MSVSGAPPDYPDSLPPTEPGPAAVPWWQHEWAVAAAALIALLAGFGVGFLVGKGSGGSAQTLSSETHLGTVTRTTTRSAPAVTHVVIHTHTVTTTAPAAPPPASEGGGAGGRSFSGTGTTAVGTVTVPRDSTLRWTCEGECSRFSIFNSESDENSIGLASGGHGGTAPVSAGTYHEVKVTTGGRWSFRIE
jgi:hypothetical protein